MLRIQTRHNFSLAQRDHPKARKETSSIYLLCRRCTGPSSAASTQPVRFVCGSAPQAHCMHTQQPQSCGPPGAPAKQLTMRSTKSSSVASARPPSSSHQARHRVGRGQGEKDGDTSQQPASPKHASPRLQLSRERILNLTRSSFAHFGRKNASERLIQVVWRGERVCRPTSVV